MAPKPPNVRRAPAQPWRASITRLRALREAAGVGVAAVEAAALPAAAVWCADVGSGVAGGARERGLETAAVGALLVGRVDAALVFAQARPPFVAGLGDVDSAGG